MSDEKEQHDSSSQHEHQIKTNTPNTKLEAVIRKDRVLKKLGTSVNLWLGHSVNGRMCIYVPELNLYWLISI